MANINVTYDQMTDAAGRLSTGKEEITQKLVDLNTMITQLVSNGYVTEQSSVAFNDTFEKYVQNTKGAIAALEDLSMFLKKAAEALRQTDTSLANTLRGTE